MSEEGNDGVPYTGNHHNHHHNQHLDENEATKIIVLQLSFTSLEETVHDYFSKFGEIEKLDLKRYPDGSSRGFAFIVYRSEDSLGRVLAEEEHVIDNRKVTVEKARTRAEKMQTNKIFIGKLPADLTEDHLREYFAEFGEIEEIQFVFNKQTNERKSFCFIQFKDSEAVERITESKVPPDSARHTIESFEVECKKKFEDNHPVQRKIKAIERQRKGLWGDYPPGVGGGYGAGYGSYYGPGSYDFYNYGYYGGYYGGAAGGGNHGYNHGGTPGREVYGYGYEDYSNANYSNGASYPSPKYTNGNGRSRPRNAKSYEG